MSSSINPTQTIIIGGTPTNYCSSKCSCTIYDNISYFSAGNSSGYLSLTPVDTTSKVLTYQGINYTCANIDILSTSINQYTTTSSSASPSITEGEMMIYFESQGGGGNVLIVTIPLSTTGNSFGAAKLQSIIAIASSSLNSTTQTYVNSIPEFSLLDFIPLNSPFYTYTTSSPAAIVIAFSTTNAIYIASQTQSQIFNLQSEEIQSSLDYYVCYTYYIVGNAIAGTSPNSNSQGVDMIENSSGISNGGITDDIYIDCSPTDDANPDGENTTTTTTTASASSTTKPSSVNSSVVFSEMGVYLLYGLGVMLLLFLIHFLFTFQEIPKFVKKIKESHKPSAPP